MLAGHVRILLAIACIAPLAKAGAEPPELGPRPCLADSYGDPLPHGAVARLGSVRLRHAEMKDFALAADGMSAVTVGSDGMVRHWNATTGPQTRAFRVPTDRLQFRPALFDGGRLLAMHREGKLAIWDVGAERELHSFPGTQGFIDCIVVSPNGAIAAIGVDGCRLQVVSLRSGQSRTVELAKPPEAWGHRPFLRAAFSSDGKRLVAWGINWGTAVAVIDVAEADKVIAKPGRASSADISPDGSRVAYCEMADDGKRRRALLRLLDVASGKVEDLHSDELDPDGFCVAFRPDGKTLDCSGIDRGCRIDLTTGRASRGVARRVDVLRYSADARVCAASDGSQLVLWDVATGKKLLDDPAYFGYNSLAVSPDSRWLAVDAYDAPPTLQLWDLATGRLAHRFALPSNHWRFEDLVFSPDGTTLSGCGEGGIIRSWDIVRGRANRPVFLWEKDDPGGPYHDHRLSADGRRVAALVRADEEGDKRCLHVWDAASGRAIHRHNLNLKEQAIETQAWLPDGMRIAVKLAAHVAFVDVDTGRVGARIPAEEAQCFSVDGRMVASWREEKTGQGKVIVWEVDSGGQIVADAKVGYRHNALALVRASRALVLADGNAVRVLDLATGKERGRLSLPDFGFGFAAKHSVDKLVALPDNRHVLTTLADGTALVWDLSAFAPSRLSEKHGEAELRAWWGELAGDDAARAFIAICKFAEAPAEEAVRFLRDRVRPVPAVTTQTIRAIMVELDNPRFAAREEAARRLRQMGPTILPVLRSPLPMQSAEARERLSKLEAELLKPVPPAETLQVLRALAVLELLGTSSARKLVEELAAGGEDAPETKSARSTLGRMKQDWTRPVRPLGTLR